MNIIYTKTFRKKLYHYLLPILLLFLGALLRLFALGEVPGGMHQDESFVALNALDLYHEGRDSAGLFWPVYMSSWGDGQSAMYIWLLLPLIALNGGTVNAFICRIPQAAVGILTLWAVYCLMKYMFNRKIGLISLFFLAICPWHIMMNRWGLDANIAPGFLIFALYFFIRGLDKPKYLLLSAFFYGFSLYCYAVIWPIVPFLLASQGIYAFYHRKISINITTICAILIVFLLALPLILFVLINSDYLPAITLPFMTIPRTMGYRGSELATDLNTFIANLRNALSLLYHQNTGSPYDVLLPWGLFYDIGRVFIIFGTLCLLIRFLKGLFRKTFSYEYFLFVSLTGGGLTCLLVSANLHQINNLFIPLVLCEAYGVYHFLHLLHTKKQQLCHITAAILFFVYLTCLILFQRDYYTSYKDLVNAYFAAGVEESVDYALAQCEETGLSTISVEKGAQWPRLLLHTETLPSQYLATVEYDVAPAPAAFTTANGIHIKTRINYDAISNDTIYIIYYTDYDRFKEHFTLTPFYDWYVAVPTRE